MSRVYFESWIDPAGVQRFPSYQLLKGMRESIRLLLEQHSSFPDGTTVLTCVDTLMANHRCVIPAADIASGTALALGLAGLGARCVVSEFDAAGRCEICLSDTVIEIAEEPPGVRVFCCSSCLELKRACPSCGGQGWLRHYRTDSPSNDWYTCDECCATWTREISEALPN